MPDRTRALPGAGRAENMWRTRGRKRVTLVQSCANPLLLASCTASMPLVAVPVSDRADTRRAAAHHAAPAAPRHDTVVVRLNRQRQLAGSLRTTTFSTPRSSVSTHAARPDALVARGIGCAGSVPT
jgi:hypothetical protein